MGAMGKVGPKAQTPGNHTQGSFTTGKKSVVCNIKYSL